MDPSVRSVENYACSAGIFTVSLRFDAADGVWRVAFAFDPKRNAVLLIAGDKSGGGEKRFYRQLISKSRRKI